MSYCEKCSSDKLLEQNECVHTHWKDHGDHYQCTTCTKIDNKNTEREYY